MRNDGPIIIRTSIPPEAFARANAWYLQHGAELGAFAIDGKVVWHLRCLRCNHWWNPAATPYPLALDKPWICPSGCNAPAALN